MKKDKNADGGKKTKTLERNASNIKYERFKQQTT